MQTAPRAVSRSATKLLRIASAILAAASCSAPSAPIDDAGCALADQKAFLRSWIDETYLWYGEVPYADPAQFGSAESYFAVLKTPAVTASGRPKDRFHFSYPTDVWVALSQSGAEAGYGVQWLILAPSPPRTTVAAYVEPGSPAALAGIARGAEVVTVDGVDMAYGGDVATLNAGMFPPAAGATHTLTIREGAVTRDVTLTSAVIESSPVLDVSTIAVEGGTVGYVLFNDHFATAEAQLVAAVEQLRDAAVDDLVLDLRYNGGGYLAIASELAYMIAGPSATSGKAFERMVFNDKLPTADPMPFLDTTQGFSVTRGAALPVLGLGRVFVLTGGGTCSASESIINGLRGVGVQVVQIGATTCGKPYAFIPEDNCGTTWFAIQMQGVNELGFGDYGDGFVPGGAGVAGVTGCAVADDFQHALGDPAEGRLAAALAYRASGTCPTMAVARALASKPSPTGESEGVKSPWRQNRILTR